MTSTKYVETAINNVNAVQSCVQSVTVDSECALRRHLALAALTDEFNDLNTNTTTSVSLYHLLTMIL